MNDEWIKVDSLLEVDDLAERIQEIEQEKEMWESILDNYVLQYKFEIGEHEEKKVDQFCIGKVYALELWVRESYYQMAKEIIDEVKNAPTSNEAWELQNEVPIEEEELAEPEDIVVTKDETNGEKQKTQNTVAVTYIVFLIVVLTIGYFSLLMALLNRETININSIFTLILVFLANMALLVGIIVIITKKRKKE